jgi:hypothetical protein
MKLRIHENTLRLRLGEKELARLAEKGRIESSLRFGSGDRELLVYSLEKDGGIRGISADLADHRIRIRIEPDEADRLTRGEEETIAGGHPVGGNGSLEIRVERDLLG